MAELYKKVVGVRFARVSKIYHFNSDGFDLSVNDSVIVETSKGRQIGVVIEIIPDFINTNESLKPIEKIATPNELVSQEMWNSKKNDVLEFCRKRSNDLGIRNIKFLEAEYNYDGTYIFIAFSSQTEEKVDLKTLKFDVQKAFPNLNYIEIRQFGPRDVAKKMCGMGACGMSSRCCSKFLTEFSSISIKMAKEQGISLTPAEITGMCGRLRCCLVYENELYVEGRKTLPKKNKRVMTPQGEGKVVEVFPLRQTVLVDVYDSGRREYSKDEITYDVNNNNDSEGGTNQKDDKPEEESNIDEDIPDDNTLNGQIMNDHSDEVANGSDNIKEDPEDNSLEEDDGKK